jgi:hypothetical protein
VIQRSLLTIILASILMLIPLASSQSENPELPPSSQKQLRELDTGQLNEDTAYTRDFVALSGNYRHRMELGYLYSGADADDIDEGIFQWDYVTHLSYMNQVSENNWLRFKHMFWEYLDEGSRNLYELEWRRKLKPFTFFSMFADYTKDNEGYDYGALYLGYQGLFRRDMQWYGQISMGANEDQDVSTGLFLEVRKPLSPSTMLRISEDFSYFDNQYTSNQVRVNISQALCRRAALNIGYRSFVSDSHEDNSDDEDDRDPVSFSNEVSSTLVFQAKDNLFLTGGYRHYWNNDSVGVNSFTTGVTWNANSRLKLLSGYQFQRYNDGPHNHGLQASLIFSF